VTQKTAIRPEIQALRAVAVAGVVIFHLWPNRLTGGYAGVDVFFVISGFLITAHLLREGYSTGGISVSRFYARRIRRLLPAAFLVLAVTLVGIFTLSPTRDWPFFLQSVAASALYVENWFAAVNAVDYFASENAASPVQHYWSLSAEEQFYLVWPLLILLTFLFTAKRTALRPRVLAAVLGLVFVGCLAYSVIATPLDPTFVYFATPAHGWEFAAGGLLALGADRLERSRWQDFVVVRSLASTVGLVLIVVSFFIFDADTVFPGWVALIPVVGTVAVIAAGTGLARWAPTSWLSWRPVQFVGDTSYATYLWHWPLIVFAPALLVRPLGFVDKVVILVAVLLLSWLTRRYVERPVIEGVAWRPRRVAYGAAAAATAVIVGAALVPIPVLHDQAVAAQQQIADRVDGGDDCLGAPALESTDCEFRLSVDPAFTGPEALEVPPVSTLRGVDDVALSSSCADAAHGSSECVAGPADASAVIALVGDSHAEAVQPGVEFSTTERDWEVRSYTRRSCPAIDAEWSAQPEYSYKEGDPECRAWRASMIEQIAADPDIDVVVVSSFGRRYGATDAATEEMAAALSRTWMRWVEAGKEVVVVGELPTTSSDVATCVTKRDASTDCSRPRAEAMAPEPMERAVQLAASPHITVMDLSPGVCDDELCYAAVGGLPVYEDWHHLTPAFARSLTPLMLPSIDSALDRRAGGDAG